MTPHFPGADAIATFFGRWPSFHDAEILTVHIDRQGQRSSMRVLTSLMTDRTDEAGYFIKDREAVVTFEFSGITSLQLEGEDADRQNVVSSIDIETNDSGYRIILGPCYGISGELTVGTLAAHVEPGKPAQT